MRVHVWKAGRRGMAAWGVAWILLHGTALAQAPAVREGHAASEQDPAAVPAWAGPDADFRREGDRILGPWWQGGGPAAVYYTGPSAQFHRSFEQVGRAIAREAGGAYLRVGLEALLPGEAHPHGIWLYPDRTARVRLLLMPGGNSAVAMAAFAGLSAPTQEAMRAERSKFPAARVNPQTAFRTGMSYVGTCGGFFTADSGYTIPRALHTGWGLWPGRVGGIGPGQRRPFPDIIFDPAHAGHPLYEATEDGVLRGMYYNGGPLGVESGVADTEYLGRYHGGAMPALEGDHFLVSYKPSEAPLSGRCVIVTGHPEVHHADFLLAMARYALDHVYEVTVRPIDPGEPIEAVSGDLQMQYYEVRPGPGRRMTATLSGAEGRVALYLRAGLPPSFRHHDAVGGPPGVADPELVVARTTDGPYLLGVYGRHDETRGVPYTLRVQTAP